MGDRRREKSKNKYGNLRLEAIKVTIEEKKKYNARALEIVTDLSESTVGEDSLLKSLQNINQEHYQDIIDERAINKMCGYPICSNSLKDIPSKQYHISTIHNKVFDITDRKNFCSNLCYKASKYLQNQILTSPVWLRDGIEATTYKLFSLKSERGFAGVEVDFGITSINTDLDKISTNDNTHSTGTSDANGFHGLPAVENKTEKSSSIRSENYFPSSVPDSDYCETSLLDLSSHFCKFKEINPINEIEPKDDTSQCLEIGHESCSECVLNEKQSTDSEDITHSHKLCSNLNSDVNLLATQKSINIQSKQDNLQDVNCFSNSFCNMISVQKSKPNDEASCSSLVTEDFGVTPKMSTQNLVIKKTTRKKLVKKKNTLDQMLPMQNIVLKTEEILKEWFTLESLCFLFGEGKVKELLAERCVISKEWQNMSGTSIVDSNFYERYLAVCRKLNILELEDTKIDASFREETKKPLPDYDALKKEAKELDLKVKMFYKGDKVVQFEETKQNFSTFGDTSMNEPVLPLVDLHAQKALRRRIVLDKLRRTLQDLQGSLGLKGFNLSEDVRALVSTFSLSAHNVTMKPAEWNLMAIVVIKLLSLRYKSLEQSLNNDCSTKHLALLLMSYSLDNGYLDRLIYWLTDIDLLIKK